MLSGNLALEIRDTLRKCIPELLSEVAYDEAGAGTSLQLSSYLASLEQHCLDVTPATVLRRGDGFGVKSSLDVRQVFACLDLKTAPN